MIRDYIAEAIQTGLAARYTSQGMPRQYISEARYREAVDAVWDAVSPHLTTAISEQVNVIEHGNPA